LSGVKSEAADQRLLRASGSCRVLGSNTSNRVTFVLSVWRARQQVQWFCAPQGDAGFWEATTATE
jgi:hypothetical protein